MKSFQSSAIYTPCGIIDGHLLVEGEKIHSIVEGPTPQNFSGELYDLKNQALLPGFVDCHVHINEPGRTDWEGFATATQAAAAGGITTLVDMPLNCLPVTTTKAALEKKLAAVKNQMWVDCGFWGGVIPQSIQDLEELIEAGVFGVKSFLIDSGIPEFPQMQEQDLKQAMTILKRYQIPYLIHAEIEIENSVQVTPAYSSFVASRPRAWENAAIKLMMKLCAEFQTPVHIVHLSSSDLIAEISQFKQQHPFTVETCPHYLLFASESISAGETLYKCCPPIREKNNAEKLWKAVAEDKIDLLVSDHSPCTANLKLMDEGDLEKAWGGIASLQFTLPLMWQAFYQRKLSLEKLIEMMAKNTADFVGLKNKGQLSGGFDADFIIFERERENQVKFEEIRFKNKITPYLGHATRGYIQATYLRGECIYNNNQLAEKPSGKILKRG